MKVKDCLGLLLLTLCSALLGYLVMPGIGYWYLMSVVWVPVLYGLGKVKRAWVAGLMWWCAMLVTTALVTHFFPVYMKAAFTLSWVVFSVHMSLFYILEALPFLVVGWMVHRFRLLMQPLGPVVIAALITFAYQVFPFVFAKESLVIGLYQQPWMLQWADWGGAKLIIFMMVFMNAFLARMLLNGGRIKWVIAREATVMAVVFFLFLGSSALRYHRWQVRTDPAKSAKTVKVGMVQINMPGVDLSDYYGEYFPDEEQDNSAHTAAYQTMQLVSEHPGLDLVVWPETTQDVAYSHDAFLRSKMEQVVAMKDGAPLLYVAMDPWMWSYPEPYLKGKNSAYLLGKDLQSRGVYSKMNLIPFFEYIPMEEGFPWLRKAFPAVGQLSPGETFEPVQIGDKLKVMPLICFDGLFSHFVRKFCAKGGNMLISLENATSFAANTNASEIQFASVLFRAIENRRPWVRLVNSGVSRAVHASGEEDFASRTPFFKRATSVTMLVPMEKKTVYQGGGYLFPYFAFALALIYLYKKRSEIVSRKS